ETGDLAASGLPYVYPGISCATLLFVSGPLFDSGPDARFRSMMFIPPHPSTRDFRILRRNAAGTRVDRPGLRRVLDMRASSKVSSDGRFYDSDPRKLRSSLRPHGCKPPLL